MTRRLAESVGYAEAIPGLLWLAAVVAAAILAAVAGRMLFRRLAFSARTVAPALTLEEVRRLRDRSRLTEAEYEALRNKLLARAAEPAGRA